MLSGWGRFGRAAIVVGFCGLALGACGSARLGGAGPAVAARALAAPPPADPVVTTLPSAPVTSEPLPPPPGATAAAPLGSGGPPEPVPVMPGAPGPVATLGSPAAPLPAPASQGTSRSGSVGTWTARDATGATCRITLTSTPTLDLYRANAGGCTNRDLAKVTAWDLRDGEVYLYQPGGAVAARLKAGGSELSGVLARSGAHLTLAR